MRREVERKKNSKFTRRKIIIAAIVAVLLVVFCVWQNKGLTVTQYKVTNSKNSSTLRIVQISDLHNASFGRDNKWLLDKVRKEKPDIIVITGDLVDSGHTDISTAVSLVDALTDIAPTYYVNGNHEPWLDAATEESLYDSIEKAGAVLLMNTYTRLEGNIILAGLDDSSLNDNTLMEMLQNAEDDCYVILLAHEPQYINNYAAGGADLVLTGHVHGGQFRLPIAGGLLSPEHGFFPEYSEGLVRSGNTDMIISRGLGNSVIPLRLFNRPEIVSVDIL